MNQTLASAARLGLLFLAAVAVMAVVLITRGGDTAPAVALDTVADSAPAAAVPQAGPAGFPDGEVAGFPPPGEFPDFSISQGGQCDTNIDNKKCLVPPGGSFEVDVVLKDVGNIVPKEAYTDIGVRLDYSWNLTVKKPPVPAPGSPCDGVGGGG